MFEVTKSLHSSLLTENKVVATCYHLTMVVVKEMSTPKTNKKAMQNHKK